MFERTHFAINKISTIILAAALSLSFFTPSSARAEQSVQPLTHHEQPAELSGLSTVTLKLSGMHCAACSVKIRKALKAMDGVKELSEGKSKKHLLIKYNSALVTPAALVKKVKETGYQATVEK